MWSVYDNGHEAVIKLTLYGIVDASEGIGPHVSRIAFLWLCGWYTPSIPLTTADKVEVKINVSLEKTLDDVISQCFLYSMF